MPRKKTVPSRGVLKTAAAGEGARFDHPRYHPSRDLEAYVEHFWVVRWDLRGLPPHRVETLPHPCVHLTFERDKGAVVRGVGRGKFSTLLDGKGGVFAAKFRPGGFHPFARAPVAAFTDAVVTLRSVWGRDGDALAREIFAASDDDDDARIAIVEDFLRARQPAPDPLVALSTTIVDAIAADRTLRTVDDVVRRFGLNLRRLQRLFSQYVGVNPKWVIQRYRLHDAAEQLALGPSSQAALAAELGYADQAHFVKDFKRVVGTSPAAYAKQAQPAKGGAPTGAAPHSGDDD